MSEYVLGIDPGWSGGAALLGRADGTLIESVPFAGLTEADIIGKVSCMARTAIIAYIERVHSMPAQGVASSFKFGWSYGLLRGLVVGTVRTFDVTPQTWQKALGCLSHGDKNVTKAKAQQLFPGVKVTHGNADALCISYYGHLRESGRLSR